MTSTPQPLLAYAEDNTLFIKLIGRANVSCSVAFKRLLESARAEGISRYVLDLEGCILMDSTFLGVLAMHGIAQATQDAEGSRILLVRPNERIQDLLDNLGVLESFDLLDQAAEGTSEAPYTEVETETSSREDVTRTSLEAHRALMALSPENEAKFKDVARFLEENLKRSTPPPED